MSTAPLTFAQFASKVRDKYPGAYDSLSDTQLVGKIVDKYPAYKDQIQNYTQTAFEKERSGGGGVMGALKSFLPPDPTGGRSLLDPKAWFNADEAKFDPTGPGTAYSDLTRPLPKDLPTDALVSARGEKTGPVAHALGRGIYRGASLLAPLAGANAENMEEASAKGDTAGVATQAAVPAALALTPLLTEGAARGTAAGQLKVGEAIRTPEGKLAPVPKALGQAAGAAVGTGGGALFGHPYVGAALGYKLAPPLMERMFPKPHVEFGAPFPSADEFYENRGADLMRRGDQQAKLDAAQPNAERRPMFPLVGTPEDIAAFDQRMSNLKREAQAGGMYSAARGRIGRKLDYQQRTFKDYTE